MANVSRGPSRSRGARWSKRGVVALVFVAGVAAAMAACLPGGNAVPAGDEADAGGLSLGDGSALGPRADVDLGDPFALDGLLPAHGPFSGKTRALVSGRGFSSDMRVFVGGVEVPREAVFASNVTRIAIEVPPGKPGPAEVRVKNTKTAEERALPAGFTYDAVVLRPDSGATSGGTRIEVEGSGTAFVPATTVAIGGRPCTDVSVKDATHLACTTPEHSAGAKDVVVTTGVDRIQVREAYTYSDAADGYRGGLSGGALAGRIKVLAFDSFTGKPLAGGTVVVGGDLATAKIAKVSQSGAVEISDPSFTSKLTVSVAAKCHQPMTFVDVPVDTVTVYLDPVMDLSCAEGDPPSIGGGGGRFGGIIEGELVFPGGVEFRRAGWSGVPAPKRPTERQAAYVFFSQTSPGERFVLPEAVTAVTPDSPGSAGYLFNVVGAPGNHTLYAVAGLEDRSESPPRFVPYVLGFVRGVGLGARQKVVGADIFMNVIADAPLAVSATTPPPAPRSPDRLVTQVALSLGTGFATLPLGERTTLLPVTAPITYVGLPSLDAAAATESYVISARAVSGPRAELPLSAVSRVRTNGQQIALGGFLPVPQMVAPAAGAWDGKRIKFNMIPESTTADLVKVSVMSRGGLVGWTIVLPGNVRDAAVPDLSALPGPDMLGLVRGPIVSTVSVARIEAFDYGRLRFGQLGSGSWSASAVDSLAGVF